MALTDNSRRGATIIGRRTWFCAGITLVVMGMVAIAAELVLQQQLHLSKCDESHDGIFQSLNVKAGIWFGIPIIFYGLLTISVGICRNKAMVIMLALLSVLFILLALTLLLISEANIVSRYNHNISFKGRGTEVNEEPQPMTAQQGGPYLRFSPPDKIIMLERKILRGDHDTNLDGKSSNMNNNNNNNNNNHNIRYQHEPDTKSDNRRVGNWPENTEDRGYDMDLDFLKQSFSGGKAVKFGEIPLSSADVSSNDIARSTVTTTLMSETSEALDEWSGSGAGLDDDEDSFRAAEEEPEKDEYGLYDSELEEGEGNKTAEEQYISIRTDWYEGHFSWTRKKRDLSQDCLEVEVATRQWLIQLMSCLMAAVGFIVLVLSIVMATLIFAPFCCYQKDKLANAQKSSQMQSETSAAAAEKDDISVLSDDATLLQV